MSSLADSLARYACSITFETYLNQHTVTVHLQDMIVTRNR